MGAADANAVVISCQEEIAVITGHVFFPSVRYLDSVAGSLEYVYY